MEKTSEIYFEQHFRVLATSASIKVCCFFLKKVKSNASLSTRTIPQHFKIIIKSKAEVELLAVQAKERFARKKGTP